MDRTGQQIRRRRLAVLRDRCRVVVFQHFQQVGLVVVALGVAGHLDAVPLLRILAVDERLLQISHHLLSDRLLHGQVFLDALPLVAVLGGSIFGVLLFRFPLVLIAAIYSAKKRNTNNRVNFVC